MKINSTGSLSTALTRSGARRRGDEFQDVQSLDVLVNWLEDTTRYEWVSLEADKSGALDDITAMRPDGTFQGWQIKYSTNPNNPQDPLTWDDLLEQKSGERGKRKTSLLQKWFSTYQQLAAKKTSFDGGLISNRQGASALQLSAGRDGFVQWEQLPPDVQQKILAQLGQKDAVRSFFAIFSFRLCEPSLRQLEAGVRLRFARLGGTPNGWYDLTHAVAEWINTKNNPAPAGRISLEDVRAVARLRLVTLRVFPPPVIYFEPYLEPRRLFHHRLPQIGRRQELSQLLAFVSGTKRIAILPGRGGNGKSKLLHTLCRRLTKREPCVAVRLRAENLSIRLEDLQELPDGRTLVIVDDAHRGEGLEVLLNLARRNPDVQVLLVTRPHATEYLIAQVRNAGFDRAEIESFAPLPDLDYYTNVRRLARTVLGQEWAGYTDALAKVTRDCPLLTVLGGQLLRSKQIAPDLLPRDDDFRQEVLRQFRDVQFGGFISQMNGQFSPELCMEVLPLIAVTTPLNLGDDGVLGVVAELASTDVIKLKKLIGAMTEAGILVRGGKLVRIVPDVLSDFILQEACLSSNGEPTGWALRVYNAFADLRLDAVLRNLAELDWRVRTSPCGEGASSAETSLLDGVWDDIEDRFRNGSLAERKGWMGRLERMAFMAPRRLWRLAQIARDEPKDEDPDEVSPSLSHWIKPTTQSDIYNALLPILRGIACDERYTARCADWLWVMGRDFDAGPKKIAGAMTTLCKIAGYERHKPLLFNHIILDCCREWLRDPNVFSHHNSVLDVLKPMLARQVNWSESDGRHFSHGSFTLSRNPLLDLRQEVLELVKQCASSDARHVLLQVLSCLQTPLSEHDLWDLKQEHLEEWNTWEDEMLAAMKIVDSIAQSTSDPFVQLRIWEELHEQAYRGPRPAVQQHARAILERIPHTFESRFILLITGQHSADTFRPVWQPDESSVDDWLKAEEPKRPAIDFLRYERKKEFAQQVAREWVERFPDAQQGFDALNLWVGDIENSGWWDRFWTRWNDFLLQLTADFPNYARAWCGIALTQPESHAAGRCDDLLYGLRLQDQDDALRITQKFMANGHPNLTLRVASSYSFRGWPQSPRPEEWQILRLLLDSDCPPVRHSAAGIVAAVASTDEAHALELILQTDLGDDSQLADELYAIFEQRRPFDFANLSPGQLKGLLDKLVMVRSITSYHLGRFLLRAALTDPIATAALLLQRVHRKHHLDTERLQSSEFDMSSFWSSTSNAYEVLPEAGFHDEELKKIGEHPEYETALRLIRDAALQPEVVQEETLSQLFRDFSLNFGTASLEILNEWIDSGDCVRVPKAMVLLKDSYMGFYFSNTGFVSNFLTSAQRCGKVALEEVERAMERCAIYGPPRAAASNRGERSNALFHGATGALEQVKKSRVATRFYLALREDGQKTIRAEMQQEAEEEIFFRSL